MSSNDIYYVYIYKDPTNLLPFYVGMGHGGRCVSHLQEAKRSLIPVKGEHKLNKIRKILRDGLEPIIEIYIQNVSKTTAITSEKALIKKYGRMYVDETGILTNLQSGGEGAFGLIHSDETKYKISQSNKGKRTGKDNPSFGKPAWNSGKTKETNKTIQLIAEKVSKSRKGTHLGKENHFYGKTHSLETKEKMKSSWNDQRRKDYRISGIKKRIQNVIKFVKDDCEIFAFFSGFCRIQGLNPENLRHHLNNCLKTGYSKMQIGWELHLTNETSELMSDEDLLKYSGF